MFYYFNFLNVHLFLFRIILLFNANKKYIILQTYAFKKKKTENEVITTFLIHVNSINKNIDSIQIAGCTQISRGLYDKLSGELYVSMGVAGITTTIPLSVEDTNRNIYKDDTIIYILMDEDTSVCLHVNTKYNQIKDLYGLQYKFFANNKFQETFKITKEMVTKAIE